MTIIVIVCVHVGSRSGAVCVCVCGACVCVWCPAQCPAYRRGHENLVGLTRVVPGILFHGLRVCGVCKCECDEVASSKKWRPNHLPSLSRGLGSSPHASRAGSDTQLRLSRTLLLQGPQAVEHSHNRCISISHTSGRAPTNLSVPMARPWLSCMCVVFRLWLKFHDQVDDFWNGCSSHEHGL